MPLNHVEKILWVRFIVLMPRSLPVPNVRVQPKFSPRTGLQTASLLLGWPNSYAFIYAVPRTAGGKVVSLSYGGGWAQRFVATYVCAAVGITLTIALGMYNTIVGGIHVDRFP